ncbi:hypothetical protein As57867_007063, partial [Aphanomyces stellatus]
MSVFAARGLSFVRNDPSSQPFSPPCSYANYSADPSAYVCDPCKAPWNPVPGNCLPSMEEHFRLPPITVVNLVHAMIGPFGSIDMYSVSPPASLRNLVASFQGFVTSMAQSNQALGNAMTAIPSLNADPVAPLWTQAPYLYKGGDPTCVTRIGKPYVQSSFAVDVTCSNQDRHTILLGKFNALFALVASSSAPSTDVNIAAVCDMCPTLRAPCVAVMAPAAAALAIMKKDNAAAVDTIIDQVKSARDDITAIGVGTLQFAVNTNSGNDTLLTQRLLSTEPALWDVIGWVYLFEWATGVREVISFEGNVNIFPLVSNKYVPVINKAREVEVPRSACQYLWVASVIVSVVLFVVAILSTLYAGLARFRIVGRNLFQINRIVGAVWLGRPLLLLRGMTALVLFSTSPLSFDVKDGFTQFNFAPRSFFDSMVVSGEAMWISYVLNDFVLVLNFNSNADFAPVSTALCWIIHVVLDVASPPRITATIDRQCTTNYLDKLLTCTSGSIQLGSVPRALTLVLVHLGCTTFSFVGMKIWRSFRRSSKSSSASDGHLLLSATALAFLRQDVLADGTRVVDRSALAMSGVLTFGPYMFDVKLWLVVVDPEAARHAKWGMKLFPPPLLNGTDRCKSAGKTLQVVPSTALAAQETSEKVESPKASQLNRAFVVA